MDAKIAGCIESNKHRYLEELKSLLRFASVSAQQSHKDDVCSCAQWLVEHFKSLSADAALIDTELHPIVRARFGKSGGKRIIIYGHYDVQPVEPLNSWQSDPFEPNIRDGYLYARGATDDKTQFFAHVKAVESLIKSGNDIGCEIIFLLEGEEECGGKSLEKYVRQNKDELKSYAVIVSDSTLYGDSPAIGYGLRGTVGWEIIVKGPKADLHSGSFGGTVANPAIALANIIAKCIDENGNVLIPGFYDDVDSVKDWENENLKRLAFDEKAFLQKTGAKKILGDENIHPLVKMWARPTFEVNGIYGGYMAQGGKTIIPSSAGAKFSARIVPSQKPEKIAKLIVDHIKSVCPDNVELEWIGPGWSEPVVFDVDHAVYKTVANALEAGFGKKPVYIREGGSIPVVSTFCAELNCPVLLMGFGEDTDGAHSPNERFKLEHFYKAIATIAEFISKI